MKLTYKKPTKKHPRPVVFVDFQGGSCVRNSDGSFTCILPPTMGKLIAVEGEADFVLQNAHIDMRVYQEDLPEPMGKL